MKHRPTVIKTAIAILLLIALAKMSYGYYQLMRIAVCGLFIWLAYLYLQKQVISAVIGCIVLAVLFNPIIKLAIHKKEWQTIDFWLAILLIIWIITDLYKLFRGRFIF